MQVVWGNKSDSKISVKEQMTGKDLVSYFSKDLFVSKIKAKTKERSFEEFAELFVESKFVRKKEIVLEMLRSRETLGSTGIGKGIAIPHGRTTAVLDVIIAFGRSEKGIDFDSVDKKPVHLVFVVLAPPQDESNQYLPILGKLVEVLNESKYRKKLLGAETFDDFVAVFEGVD